MSLLPRSQCKLHRLVLAVCLFYLSGAMASWSVAGENGKSTYEGVLKCGPNSLFLFLLLSGYPNVRLEDLEQLPISSEGTSLLTLRDTARDLGFDAEIRRYNPEDPDMLKLPALVQFKNDGSAPTKYHFNVIYKLDKNRFYMLDGTTGIRRSGLKARLPGFWTGYALGKKRPYYGGVLSTAWTTLLAVVTVLTNLSMLSVLVLGIQNKTKVACTGK